jgi:outer membrane autotransporter protein
VGTVIDGVVVSVDPTGQSIKGPILDFMCTGLHGIIRKRLNHFKPELIKLASTRIEPGMLVKPKQPQAWGDMFHFYRKRDSDGRLFAYDHEYNGFTGGLEKKYRRLRAGVMGRFLRSNVEADSESFRIDSNSYFTGVYGQYDFGRIKLAASLISGYEVHENSRMVFDNLSGDETARADFGSMFISPSVTVRADYTVAHRLMLRPMASVTYSAGWYDDYHEHGTTRSNLEIDDCTLQALNAQLQMSAIYMIADWCEFELSAGGNARYTDDGSIDASLGGSDFRFTATNDDSVYAGQLGAYLSIALNYRLELYANGEFSDASGGETRDFFMVGLKLGF